MTAQTGETPAGSGQQQETPAPAGGSGGSDADRIGRVEQKVDRLAELVQKIVPGSHAEAQQRTEDRLNRPDDVAGQVRAELARARQEQDAAAAAEREKSEQQQLRETVRKLQETPPAAPTPRRTKLLGWGR